MQKTASQIADEVLVKLSMRMPFSKQLSAVRRANLNPADVALQAEKKQVLREGSDTFRTYERHSRGRIRPKNFSQFDKPVGSLWTQGTHTREVPQRIPKALHLFGEV
jgi:hypothetical protein